MGWWCICRPVRELIPDGRHCRLRRRSALSEWRLTRMKLRKDGCRRFWHLESVVAFVSWKSLRGKGAVFHFCISCLLFQSFFLVRDLLLLVVEPLLRVLNSMLIEESLGDPLGNFRKLWRESWFLPFTALLPEIEDQVSIMNSQALK